MAFFSKCWICLTLLLLSTWVYGESNFNINDRIDCVLVDNNITEQECTKRGCIWNTVNLDNAPWCYLDSNLVGYNSVKVKKDDNGFESTLTLKPKAKRVTPTFEQISQLKLTVDYVSQNILRIKLTDQHQQRYEVPIQSEFNIPKLFTSDSKESNYVVSLTDNGTLTVTRKATGVKLLDTAVGGLIYSNQFIQFATYLASKDVYGFGENYHVSFKHQFNYRTLPIFTRDRGVGDPNGNNYGQHPYITVVEQDGKAHGIFVLNSNAMSYTLLPSPALSLRLTGGILDLFLFVGENPEEVTQLYTSVIGRPVMPPFWGLGFQQCRWGYKNTDEVKKVIQRTLKHQVPLDVQYMDIDYMDQYRDFTYSPTHFAELPALVNETKTKYNLRWTLILDPAIQANVKGYYAFDEGYKRDVFIKWPADLANSNKIGHPKNVPSDKGVIYGKVWPDGPAAFPDFFKNSTKQWWIDMIKYLHDQIQFDGLWIDMNEPSNFDTTVDYYKCPEDKYQVINPQMRFDEPLNRKTLCMNAIQGEKGEYRHYDVHSLYGLMESPPTLQGLHEATGKRGFIVSRSTFPSSGKHAAHWLGDNVSTWEQLRQSIVGMLEFSLFGISFTGADICGFNGNTNAELCRRWFQLGAYYPFSRSHNAIDMKDQDPGYWAENGHPEVTKAAVAALRTRYQLLHYLYTCFFHSHVSGNTLVRPMHHVFPTDTGARDIDEQFFLGPSVMVSPFLYKDQNYVEAYLPMTSEWYRLSQNFVEKIHEQSSHYRFNDEDSDRPLLIQAGTILPVVEEKNFPSTLNTVTLRKVPIQLWLLPNSNGNAVGDLFYDDGESIDTVASGNYNYYLFQLNDCQLHIDVVHSGLQPQPESEDILRVNQIKVALDSTKNINDQNLQVHIDNSDRKLKAHIKNQTLIIELVEQLDLFQTKNNVTIEFTNKQTHECFVH